MPHSCGRFYEFTASKDAKAKRKDKWLFTLKGGDLFGIAGIWRAKTANGQDAWTMLTCEPGPDIAPYHDRQVVVLGPERWSEWLDGANETKTLAASEAGSIVVQKAS